MMNGRFRKLLSRSARSMCAVFFAAAILSASGLANAQERNVDHRIEEVRARIHALVTDGERLVAQGREAAAAECFAEAEALEAELHAWIANMEREHAERAVHETERGHHYIAALEHLEHAMMILNEHGNTELAMQIDRVADQIRERVHRIERERGQDEEHPERRAARHQIEALHLALGSLREAEREDAVHLVELAIMAREMGLEGRRDDEAQHIRQQQPNREQLRRILGMSIELYQEFGAHDRAEHLAAAVRELWPSREGDRDRRPEQKREESGEVLELMRVAMHGLMEAGRKDATELLEHAIHARVLRMEGARSEEAMHVLEIAPSHGQVIELLAFASRIWAEFGHETKAEQIGRLAEGMARELRGQRDAEDQRDVARRDRERATAAERDQHIRVLEERLAELTRAVEEIHHELDRARDQDQRDR